MKSAVPKKMCVWKCSHDSMIGSPGNRSEHLHHLRLTWLPLDFAVLSAADPMLFTSELGLFISTTYYRSKRFFSIFWTFDVNLKRFDLWKHFRNVVSSFHSWKFQHVDYYTAWSYSTKFVEKTDLPNDGQTCGHRFADVIWRIPNPTLRVDLNPLEKKATSSEVRNVMIDFPTLFLKWYQKHVKVRFCYLLWHDNFCKGPWTLRKFPQKCQKIAGLETWLIPSGTNQSRQYHESTMVWRNLPPYHRF